MTARLYYDDAYLRSFRARVVERAGDRIYLDRSAFYPSSGGQPFDTGTIGGARVVEVVDEGERVAHRVEGDAGGEEADCAIDWARRFDHMQQHTGQHLLSGVLFEQFGLVTVSFHMSAEVSTIDVEAALVDAEKLAAIEAAANAAVCANREVTVGYSEDREALRRDVERTGTLRVVTIDGIDRSACGGTHVRRTGELGTILLRGTEKIRGNTRIEFLCGGRAIGLARREYASLAAVARALSCGTEEVPAKTAALLARVADADRERKKLSLELATLRGREMHAAAAPNGAGLRVAVVRAAPDDAVRAEGQAFAACGRAVYIAAGSAGTLLVAVSDDAGIAAGAALKAVVGRYGGKGGGGATLAQGAVPAAAVEGAVEALLALVG